MPVVVTVDTTIRARESRSERIEYRSCRRDLSGRDRVQPYPRSAPAAQSWDQAQPVSPRAHRLAADERSPRYPANNGGHRGEQQQVEDEQSKHEAPLAATMLLRVRRHSRGDAHDAAEASCAVASPTGAAGI